MTNGFIVVIFMICVWTPMVSSAHRGVVGFQLAVLELDLSNTY
jgi:hypothetical protein